MNVLTDTRTGGCISIIPCGAAGGFDYRRTLTGNMRRQSRTTASVRSCAG